MDECGNYTTEFDEVCRQLDISKPDNSQSFIKYKTVMGYMSVGGYKKPHIRAIKSGSTICFLADKPINLPKYGFLGEKNGEGFGKVRFIRADDIMKLDDISFSANRTAPEPDDKLCRLLDKKALRESVRSEAIRYAKAHRKEFVDTQKGNSESNSITASFIGRVYLMIRQAKDYNDLLDRIDTIKTDSKRIAASEMAHTAEQYKDNGLWREYLEIIFLLAKYFNREAE